MKIRVTSFLLSDFLTMYVILFLFLLTLLMQNFRNLSKINCILHTVYRLITLFLIVLCRLLFLYNTVALVQTFDKSETSVEKNVF